MANLIEFLITINEIFMLLDFLVSFNFKKDKKRKLFQPLEFLQTWNKICLRNVTSFLFIHRCIRAQELLKLQASWQNDIFCILYNLVKAENRCDGTHGFRLN